MRINDVARIAGVTARTIRFYHRIGLIEEPARDTNNYRRYEVRHVVRLLRVRRLSSLGFALDDIRTLIDGGNDSAREALATLDDELAAQIDRLSRQRELVASLIGSPAAPDIPVEFARFNTIIADGLSEDRQRIAAESSVLLAHLANAEEMSHLTEMFERMVQPTLLAKLTGLGRRYRALTADSSEAETHALIEDFQKILVALQPDQTDFANLSRPSATNLILGHAIAGANRRQRQVLEEISRNVGQAAT